MSECALSIRLMGFPACSPSLCLVCVRLSSSASLSVCPSVCSLSLSVYFCVSLSLSPLFLPLCSSTSMSVRPSLSLSFRPSVCSLCVRLSVCPFALSLSRCPTPTPASLSLSLCISVRSEQCRLYKNVQAAQRRSNSTKGEESISFLMEQNRTVCQLAALYRHTRTTEKELLVLRSLDLLSSQKAFLLFGCFHIQLLGSWCSSC